MRYFIETRSQPPKTGRSGWSGPDTYVAVQCVPEGTEPLRVLRQDTARKRGIHIKYFGEGYKRHHGPRSALGRALQAAQEWIEEQGE